MNKKTIYGLSIGLVVVVLISTAVSAHGIYDGNEIGGSQDTMSSYMRNMYGSNTNSISMGNMMNIPIQQMMNNMNYNNNDKLKWYQPQQYITTKIKQGTNSNTRMACH
ncbi:hypothetical protein HYY69_03405 [Candidatus Woesearchaeota archaeon]|nr:hypothetical protein [Candidatus Woesearchaeota archaeon]